MPEEWRRPAACPRVTDSAVVDRAGGAAARTARREHRATDAARADRSVSRRCSAPPCNPARPGMQPHSHRPAILRAQHATPHAQYASFCVQGAMLRRQAADRAGLRRRARRAERAAGAGAAAGGYRALYLRAHGSLLSSDGHGPCAWPRSERSCLVSNLKYISKRNAYNATKNVNPERPAERVRLTVKGVPYLVHHGDGAETAVTTYGSLGLRLDVRRARLLQSSEVLRPVLRARVSRLLILYASAQITSVSFYHLERSTLQQSTTLVWHSHLKHAHRCSGADGHRYPLPPSCRNRLPNRLDLLACQRQLLPRASRALHLAPPLRGPVREARGHTCLHRHGGGE